MLCKYVLFVLCLTVWTAFAQQSERVDLGKLQTGATVSFVRNSGGKWGIEVSNGTTLRLKQGKPAHIEVFRTKNDIKELAAGYKTIRRSANSIYASAEIAYGENVFFHVMDWWSLNGAVLSMDRKVEVVGKATGGFSSSIIFNIDSSVHWSDINCLAPGALYGDPTHDGDRSPGGTLNYAAHRFLMREDILPAPMFGLSFSNGTSVTILDPTPNGESTFEETKLTKDVMIDDRFQFGSLGVWQNKNNPIEFGFMFPGTMSLYSFGSNALSNPQWIRRYHPITNEFAQSYKVSFRFGIRESFPKVIHNSWRWAWNTLKPAVIPIDVGQMRRILTDQLASVAATINGRTAIPFAIATFDTIRPQWNWTMAGMGFVSKNVSCANQLLLESDRDSTERGKKMRRIGLSIISSMIKALHSIPLQATGYDLSTGKPWTGEHAEWLAPWLRNATDGMLVLVKAYRRERALGLIHLEWFKWVKSYADWLMLQQRKDGSFPRCWKAGSSEVAESTGTTSYCAVPLLVQMTEVTGNPKYKQAAIRAANYVWIHWGKRGLYVGGASDNPNITDKEAGMLSMKAFLSLYESTKETKWLQYSEAAADYTESWIWIWNLPMPVDADNKQLHWKKDVSIIGVQGITARVAGGVDEYLDWATSSFAQLYLYTRDTHYLDVARILLNDTKSMVAIPGHLHGLKGVGWQQEHWGMGPNRFGRGVGSHRFWLPWVTANHLYSITGLEELDPALFKRMTEGDLR
jgi:hypothetical protein